MTWIAGSAWCLGCGETVDADELATCERCNAVWHVDCSTHKCSHEKPEEPRPEEPKPARKWWQL